MASRVTFIGAGNMASAIIGGMIDNGYPATAITATSPSDAFLAPIHDRYGIRTNTDNTAAVRDADVVVLAIKPQVMREVCEGLRDTLQRQRPLVVSVAAGIDADTLQGWLGGGLPLIRCRPNTPAVVGAGAAALFATPEVSAEQRAQAGELLESVGLVEWVEEEALLDAVTAVSGSGPAYFFLMFEAMEEAGVKLGLPAETARRLAIQTALGASRMAQESELTPARLKRNVMSPGGTTERAVEHLEQAGLRDMMIAAMEACANRAREMGDEFAQR